MGQKTGNQERSNGLKTGKKHRPKGGGHGRLKKERISHNLGERKKEGWGAKKTEN